MADSRVLPDPLHGEETEVYGDEAYQRHAEAIRTRAPKAVDRTNRRYRTKKTCYPEVRKENCQKSRTRSRVERIFGVIELHLGFTRVCYRGLPKNLHPLLSTCALINLCTANKHLFEGPAQNSA